MTDTFSKYVEGMLKIPEKREQVDLTANAKKADMRDAALSSIFGLPASTFNAWAIQNETPLTSILNRRPEQVVDFAQERQNIDNQRTITRSPSEAAYDSLLDASTAFFGTTNAAASLLTAPFSPSLSDSIAANQKALAEQQQGFQSERAQQQRALNEELNAYTDRLTTTQKEIELAQGTPEWRAELNKVGRDTLNTVINAQRTPASLGSGVSQAVGSILSIGPLTRLLSAATGASTTAAGMGAIGLTEAGSVFSEVMNEQREKGIPLQQRTNAATLAATTQLPMSIALGRLTARFEGNPFESVGGTFTGMLRNLGKNVLSQGVEEPLQGVSGQVSQNLGVRTYIDPEQSLTDGVGRAIGEGALYGSLAPGAIQAPTIAGEIVRSGAEAVNNIRTTAARLQEENRKQSPVSTENVTQAINETLNNAPQAMEAVNEAFTNEQAAPEVQEEVTSVLNDLNTALSINSDVLVQEGLPQELSEAIGPANNTLEVLHGLGRIIKNEQAPMEQRQQAVGIYQNITNTIDSVIGSDSETINGLPKDHPARVMITAYKDTLKAIQGNPETNEATNTVRKTITEAEVPVMDEQTVQTPAGQAQVDIAIAQADIAPERVNPEAAETILRHANSGAIQLTEQQKSSLQGAVSLINAARQYDAQMQAQGLTPSGVVGQEIKTGDSGSKGKSVLQHYKDIREALTAGDINTAKDLIRRFGSFAEHMQFKVGALNESIQTGEPSSYPIYSSAQDNWVTGSKLVQVHPNNEKSVSFANTVANEAAFVADVYNGLVQAFPQLERTPITITPINLEPQPVQEEAQTTEVSQDPPTTPDSTPSTPATVTPTTTGPSDTPSTSTPTSAPATTTTPTSEETGTPEQVPSRVTPEQAARLSQDGLERRIVNIISKYEEDRSPSDVATLAVLDAEFRTRQRAQRQQNQEQETPPVVERENSTTTVVEPEVQDGAPQTPETPVGYADSLVPSSRFRQVFKAAKNLKSRVIDLARPIAEIDKALVSQESIESFMGEVFKRKYSQDQANAIRRYVRSLAPALVNGMEERLNKFLSTKYRKGSDKTVGDIILEGGDIAGMSRGQAISIVEAVDGKLQYSRPLLQTAILAAIDWRLNYSRTKTDMDPSEVARALGVDEGSLSPDDILSFNSHQGSAQIVLSLTDAIKRFWGQDNVSNAPTGQTQGIPQAVAAELLNVMLETGIIEEAAPIQLVDGRTFNQYAIKPPIDAEDLRGVTDLIGRMVQVDYDSSYAIGDEASLPIPETVLRNNQVKLTPQQKRSLKIQQEQPYLPNMNTVKAYAALGVEGIQQLLLGDVSLEDLNDNHAASIQGKITSLVNGYEAAMNTFAELETSSWFSGQDVAQTPIKYRFQIIGNGRAHMQGAYNPQNNKLMREAFMPTEATVDLSDSNSDAYRMYMVALAQAAGEKVHNQTHEDSIAKVQDKFSKMPESVRMAQEWLDQSSEARVHEVPKFGKDFINTFRREATETEYDISEVSFHALLDYARFLNTTDLSNYTTKVYLEADGATNGPFNSMFLLSSGSFTPEWITNVGRGGYTFQEGMSLNEHRAKKDGTDLYKASANILQNRLANILASNTEHIEKTILGNLLSVMNLFNKDLSFDETTGKLSISRGLTKNPLTITIYGSGARGIAGNLAKELTVSIYERLSRAMELQKTSGLPIRDLVFSDTSSNVEEARAAYDKFMETINFLATHRTQEKKDQLFLVPNGKKVSIANPKKFTFTPEQITNLTSNFEYGFVNHMREAITDVVGLDVMNGATLIQKATQIQSKVLEELFNRSLKEAVQAKRDAGTWKITDFLTPKELSAIEASLADYGLTVDLGTQEFYIPNNSPTEVTGIGAYGRALDNSFELPPTVYGPSNAGVRGIPTMVIGSGDARAMQVLMSTYAPQGVTQIFDGVNLPIDKATEYSQYANQSVRESHKANPFRGVSESFQGFLNKISSEGTLDTLSEETLNDIARTLGIPNDGATAQNLLEAMQTLDNMISSRADLKDARNEALSKVTSSMDQMASAAAPDTVQGTITMDPEATPSDIAGALNDLMAASAATSGTSTVQGLDSFKNLFNRNKIFDLVNSILGSDINVVLGSRDALRSKALLDGVQGFDENTNGLFVPSTNTIYAVEGNSEVLLHEAIHAATFKNLVQFYRTGKGVVQVAAIRSAEALMNQFLNLDADLLPVQTQEAISNARAAIQNGLNKNTPEGKAEAMTEFMAWGLTNQDIMETLKNTRAERASNIATRIIGMIHRFLTRTKDFTFSKDVLSRLRFNTAVVMSSGQPGLGDVLLNTLQHNTAYGTNDRLSSIVERIANRIGAYTSKFKEGLESIEAPIRIERASMLAQEVADNMVANGFPMDMQQTAAFQKIVAIMATDMDISPSTVIRVQELYKHVMDNLSLDSFLTDKENPDPNEVYWGNLKLRALSGEFTKKLDAQGRSTLLSSFVGLAVVDEGFRNILSSMPRPKEELAAWNSLDNVFSNIGTEAIDRIGDMLSGDTLKNKDVVASLDALVNKLTDVAQDSESFLEQTSSTVSTMLGRADEYVSNAFDRLGSELESGGKYVKNKVTNPYAKVIASTTSFLGTLLKNESTGLIGEMTVAGMSKIEGWHTLREFISDLAGRTDAKGHVHDMIKTVRAVSQQTRQVFRDQVPTIIASKFKKELSNTEWAQLYRGIGKTDFAALLTNHNFEQAASIVGSDVELLKRINTIEQEAERIAGKHWKKVHAKAEQLAGYISFGEAQGNLLTNAYAISRMPGENVKLSTEVSDQLVSLIDELVTLYTFDNLSHEDKNTIRSKLVDEAEAMSYVTSYMQGLRRDENQKAKDNPMALMNGYKGYIPSIPREGMSMVIADMSEFSKLVEQSYIFVAPYEGSDIDAHLSTKGYFFRKANGRAPYNQGIMQNIRDTANGVDDMGFTFGGLNAGRITSPVLLARYANQLRHDSAKEALRPIYNGAGQLIALERLPDADIIKRLDPETNLAKSMGVQRGRQMEELYADTFNEQLIAGLEQMYKNANPSDKDAYIDILSEDTLKKDPVLKDAVDLIGNRTRQRMGKKFFVRRDMLNDAFGYRGATIGDAWTGNTRWSPETQKRVRELAMIVFKDDAYRILINAESVLQNLVSESKTIIVVKSVVVPAVNMISNLLQMVARGVPLAQMGKSLGAKVNEVDFYFNKRIRQTEIEADMRAYADDPQRMNRLKTEWQSIEDSYKRLSIWPLLQAGEFTSIADASIGMDDLELSSGKLSSYIERLVDKLPEGVRDAGRYAIITKDTALYKGLQRSVDYGDFISKAILYDHYTQRKKLSSEEALARISDEFVNYDKAAGRTRQYLEGMGLLWFYNFKIRATKVAMSMIRHNPVSTLFAMALPAPTIFGNAGMPTEDSLFAKLPDGSIMRSIGFGQGLSAPSLNPWYSLTN